MGARPTRNFPHLAVAIVVAGVVIGAGIFATSYLGMVVTVTRTSTTTLTSTALIQPCSDKVWSTNSSSTNFNVPVLLMQPESTAFICVTYQSIWEGNSSQYQSLFSGIGSYQFGLSISKEQCATSGGTTSCTANISHSFMVSASPNSIQVSGITDYATVIYTVNSLSNSTGFYDNSAPYLASCISMPMAVGFAASQVNASDFAPRVIPGCPIQMFSPSSVSVGGMNVTYTAF